MAMLVQSSLCIVAAAVLVAGAAGCATSGNDNPGAHGGSSSGGGGGGGSGSSGGSGSLVDNGDAGQLIGPLPGDAKGPRSMRCDDSGRCTCFNIASIGQPGHTGFQGGMGNDSTNAFVDYLNTQSSASVDMYAMKPNLTSDFLNRYDVIIFQWLVDGVSGENGTGYWTFSAGELNALKDWVNAGGGVITLSGYDAQSQEVMPLNQVVQAITDMSYGTADVLGTVSTANYCVGESDPLSGWVQATPIGKHVNEVGAFHGRPINPGKGIVDCSDSMYTYAAHEDVGAGHVFAYCDEWVTYTSQWLGIDAGSSCVDASASTVYQVPQFWYNAISYASQATMCPFMLNGAIR